MFNNPLVRHRLVNKVVYSLRFGWHDRLIYCGCPDVTKKNYESQKKCKQFHCSFVDVFVAQFYKSLWFLPKHVSVSRADGSLFFFLIELFNRSRSLCLVYCLKYFQSCQKWWFIIEYITRDQHVEAVSSFQNLNILLCRFS